MARIKQRKKPKKDNSCAKMELEKVIGLTTKNCSGFASNLFTGDLAYLAGCVVVIYNVEKDQQTQFLVAPRTPNPLTCVTYSHYGGKFIAAGESGHQPAILVWDSSSGKCIADLKGHGYGVSCVEFSPNGKHLASIGFAHDGFLCLWNWRKGQLLAKNKVTVSISPIESVRFSSDGNFIITAGAKHLKYWVVGTDACRRSTAGLGTLAIEGRPVYLGSQKDNSFVSISSAPLTKSIPVSTGQLAEALQPTYALTRAGILCLLHSGVTLKKWIDLKVKKGYGLALSESHIACACSNGVVRLLLQETLAYAGTLPKRTSHGPDPVNPRFPDAIACEFSASEKLAVIYEDHSLYVWDVHNISKITTVSVNFFHSLCVWDIAILPLMMHSIEGHCQGGDFVTCSADGSIRFWNIKLDKDTGSFSYMDSICDDVHYKDLLAVIYSETTEKRQEVERLVNFSQGFRSLAVSKDGKHLAAGDISGNLYVYDLDTLELSSFKEAHDGEILTLDFNVPCEINSSTSDSFKYNLLASGGRDRLIHVYDVDRELNQIETLDDHSSSVTAVRFACNCSKFLSCGADRSVVFRDIACTKSSFKSIRFHLEIASRGTIYDMDIDTVNDYAVTVGQDKKINVLSLSTGKHVKSFKHDRDVGEPIKVCVDHTGTYLICSHANNCMRIYDLSSGEDVAHASGHAEVVTGVAFLADCEHIVSVSGDSCIFVWKLPAALSREMQKKCKSCTLPLSFAAPQCQIVAGEKTVDHETDNRNTMNYIPSGMCFQKDLLATPHCSSVVRSSAFKFTVSRLPKWAQTKVVADKPVAIESSKKTSAPPTLNSFESRWAERLGNGYRLYAETCDGKTPPATIKPVCRARRDFLMHDRFASNVLTPDSSINSGDVTCSSTSEEQSNKNTRPWQTIHTVFYDEHEFPHTGPGDTEISMQPMSAALSSRFNQNFVTNRICDYDTEGSGKTIVQYVTPLKNCDMTSQAQPVGGDPLKVVNDDNSFSKSNNHDSKYRCQGKENDGSECAVSDNNFNTDRDLFNFHFGTLSTPLKVDANATSTRKSLSTCYFSHYSYTVTQASLFKDSQKKEGSFAEKESMRIDQQHPNISKYFLTTEEKQEHSEKHSHQRKIGSRLQQDFCSPENTLLTTAAGCALDSDKNSVPITKTVISGNGNMSFLESLNSSESHSDSEADYFQPRDCTSSEGISEIKNKGYLKNTPKKMKTKTADSMNASEFAVCALDSDKNSMPITKTVISGNANVSFLESLNASESHCDWEVDYFQPRDWTSSKGIYDIKNKGYLKNTPVKVEVRTARKRDTNRIRASDVLFSLDNKKVESNCCNYESLRHFPVSDSDDGLEKQGHCLLPAENISNPNRTLRELKACYQLEDFSNQPSNGSDSVKHQRNFEGHREGKSPFRLEGYKQALETLSDAAENALLLFSELGALEKPDEKQSQDLFDLISRTLPHTLDRVEKLCELTLPSYSYHLKQATSCTSVSQQARKHESSGYNEASDLQVERLKQCASSELSRENSVNSVDIEGVLERYSERLSQKISSQIVELFQRSLSSQMNT